MEKHTATLQEARDVLAGTERSSREKIVLVAPRFDVVYIEPFDEPRIRQAIEARLTNDHDAADTILKHEALSNLAQRYAAGVGELCEELLDDLTVHRTGRLCQFRRVWLRGDLI